MRDASPILTKEEYQEKKMQFDRRSNSAMVNRLDDSQVEIRKENLFIANGPKKDVKINKDSEHGTYIKHTL